MTRSVSSCAIFRSRCAKFRTLTILLATLLAVSAARAERFHLLTGVDNGQYPSTARTVFPSGFPNTGVPGTFFDGDRLAGTLPSGAPVVYVGSPPQPIIAPNAYGSLSFLYRRGSVPLGPPGPYPFMGIEFLGGPLLDLDGDLSNDTRALLPAAGMSAVLIPGTDSHVDLTFDLDAGAVTLLAADITGTNEGAPNIGPDVAVILVTLAGTEPFAPAGESPPSGPPTNPAVDTRVGTLAPFTNGGLVGVWQISDLGYELWEDSIDPFTSSPHVLGTMQFLGTWRGWLVERDAASGLFPTLAGKGLGSTLWPLVDETHIGTTWNTANGLLSGSATIARGVSGDDFTVAGNGGTALADFAGDLGAYLDEVVLPVAPAGADRVVYLEAAGFGINNSFDPVFGDSIGYDAVVIAGSGCDGRARCDANCDGAVDNGDIDAFVLALTGGRAAYHAAYPDCSYVCANDANGDGGVDNGDIDSFVACLLGE